MPSKSFRNNSPGNIRFGKFTQGYGAINDGTGFAKFTTAIQGTAAMVDLLAGPGYRDLTVEQALHRYAPRSENDTDKYLKYVCDKSALDRDQVLNQLDPFEVLDLVRAMIQFEGWIP